MKTTIEISDPLLANARKILKKEKTSLRALVEEGLRATLSKRKNRPRFKRRDAGFKGKGLQKEMQNSNWEGIRSHAYEEHGG